MDDSRFRAAREVLSAFFDEEKLRQGGRYADFFESWKYLVGEQLAAHSRVADVQNGILYIEADHPGWIQLLQMRQAAILKGIATRFPEFGLRAIAFRVRESEVPSRPSQKIADSRATEDAETETVDLQAESAQRIEVAKRLDDIRDPQLKALLSSLKNTLNEGKSGSPSQ